MPITQGTLALTMFQADSKALKSVNADNLKRFAIPPLEGVDEKAVGFAPLSDPLSDPVASGWKEHPEIGEFTAFCLRIDTRKVPGALLKKYLRDALAKEEENNRKEGKKFVSRERKKEIKDTVKLRLLGKAEPIPAAHEVVVNPGGTVYLASSSKSVIEALREQFAKCFNCELTEISETFSFETQERTWDFLTQIAREGIETDKYSIHSSGQLVVSDHDKQISGVSQSDSNIKEIQTAIESGMRVSKTGIRITCDDGEECTFTLTPLLWISGMKLPSTAKPAGVDDDSDAPLLERMFLVEKFTGIMMEAFKAFLAEGKN